MYRDLKKQDIISTRYHSQSQNLQNYKKDYYLNTDLPLFPIFKPSDILTPLNQKFKSNRKMKKNSSLLKSNILVRLKPKKHKQKQLIIIDSSQLSKNEEKVNIQKCMKWQSKLKSFSVDERIKYSQRKYQKLNKSQLMDYQNDQQENTSYLKKIINNMKESSFRRRDHSNEDVVLQIKHLQVQKDIDSNLSNRIKLPKFQPKKAMFQNKRYDNRQYATLQSHPNMQKQKNKSSNINILNIKRNRTKSKNTINQKSIEDFSLVNSRIGPWKDKT